MRFEARPRACSKVVCREIIDRLVRESCATKECVEKIKIDVCRGLRVSLPKNSDILNFLEVDERADLLKVLRTKPVRRISGVNVVAVMTEPSNCPHGKCAYCPGGPKYHVPSSYTGYEPAAMRGIQNNFDPYRQVKNRIDQLKAIGHSVSKVELIIMGGTFPSTTTRYQEDFIKDCLDAITEVDSRSLKEAQSNAEKSTVRNIGITFETRPDYCKEVHVDRMLQMGVTRVELGVQNIYDDIYKIVERGHTVQDVVTATRVTKDAGLKVCYHMMPGLPNSNIDRDLRGFKQLFDDPDFKPDMLKIYPCLVLRDTKIFDWWKEGSYRPYTIEEATHLLVQVKRSLPPWVRIMRIQRDIPAQLIVAGVKKGNLRQIVQAQMKVQGLKCSCIRCREVGHRMLEGVRVAPENVKIIIRKYHASEGLEFFLSAEDEESDTLIGYLRLRFPSPTAHRPEVEIEEVSLVRELHVYGPLTPIGVRMVNAWQHCGYGRALLKEAERVSLEYDRNKILVTSALGAKEYFKQSGYNPVGPYMGKVLHFNSMRGS